jgi:hypothetical protein
VHPTAKYSRCIGITTKGRRCRNTGGCAIHRAANEERRRHDDDAHMNSIRKANRKAEKNAVPYSLLSRDRIQELLEIGRKQEEAAKQGLGALPCGCLG